MGRKEIPKWFRVYSLITAVLVYFATVFVKQHYFIDVISGIAIATIAFAICKKVRAGRLFTKAIDLFEKKK